MLADFKSLTSDHGIRVSKERSRASESVNQIAAGKIAGEEHLENATFPKKCAQHCALLHVPDVHRLVEAATG